MDRAATIAECLAVAEATSECREVTARDVWQAYAVVAELEYLARDASELRDWRELGA